MMPRGKRPGHEVSDKYAAQHNLLDTVATPFGGVCLLLS